MENSDEILKMLYDNLLTSITIDKKLKKKSILISFLELKSNVRYRYLNDSSENLINQNEQDVALLTKNGLIRLAEEINYYSITAKGVWKIENNNVISVDEIINFVDEKYFDISLGSGNITDKERVVIMSLIAARAFSNGTSIDLKKDNYTLDACKRIIDKCNSKLFELNIVKKMKESELYGKNGNEHMVSNLIRHTDSLPKKTKGIYKAAGSQKYFLDIITDNKLDQEKIVFLLHRIFSNKQDLGYEDILSICQLCSNIAYDEAPYLHDSIGESFTTPEHDDCIIDAFKKYFFI